MYQIISSYALNLHSVTCQLDLNNAEGRTQVGLHPSSVAMPYLRKPKRSCLECLCLTAKELPPLLTAGNLGSDSTPGQSLGRGRDGTSEFKCPWGKSSPFSGPQFYHPLNGRVGLHQGFSTLLRSGQHFLHIKLRAEHTDGHGPRGSRSQALWELGTHSPHSLPEEAS